MGMPLSREALSFVLIIYIPQGHALNKILKDIINRYHVSLGRRVQ